MKVITQPAIEPITLADVKVQLGIETDDTASDVTITRRITEARQWAEAYARLALIEQTQEIRLDGFRERIPLPTQPLISIVSVAYVDINGDLQTVDSADYVADDFSLEASLRPAYGLCWPSARNESNAVRIQYKAGYGTTAASVPALIREALLLLVGHWMNYQPQAESGAGIYRVPFAIKDMLDVYAVRKIV